LNSKPDRGPVGQVTFAAASYILWLITAGTGILTLLVARQLLLEIVYALNVDPWAHGAIDKFGLLIFAMVWIVLTYGTEAYYRNAAEISLRKLLRRFALMTGTQVIFAALALLAITLLD